jgi:hypothetical protein
LGAALNAGSTVAVAAGGDGGARSDLVSGITQAGISGGIGLARTVGLVSRLATAENAVAEGRAAATVAEGTDGLSPRVRYNVDSEAGAGQIDHPVAIRSNAAPLRLTGPSQGQQNALRGNAFERDVLAALYADKNTASFTTIDGRVTTVPDLPLNSRFGVIDIKDEIRLSFDKQLRAQFDAALTARQPFGMIVSPRTQSISMPLQRAVRSTGGQLFGLTRRPGGSLQC